MFDRILNTPLETSEAFMEKYILPKYICYYMRMLHRKILSFARYMHTNTKFQNKSGYILMS